jgi:hypothetical protein
LHDLRRLRGLKPTSPSLIFLRPFLVLAVYPQRKDVHVTSGAVTLLQGLLIKISPNTALAYLSETPAFFEGFFFGGPVRRQTNFGQPLGMIQRRVPREVTNMTSNLDFPVCREMINAPTAAYCSDRCRGE